MARVGHHSQLLDNASATGSWVNWPGGKGVCSFEGTLGGATLTLQAQSDQGTALDIVSTSSAGVEEFEAAAGQLRVLVSGGSPSALYARAVRTG